MTILLVRFEINMKIWIYLVQVYIQVRAFQRSENYLNDQLSIILINDIQKSIIL